MAFSSFANNGTGGAFGSGGSVSGPNSDTPAPLDSQFGPELPEITTETIEFHRFNGETKLKLLPEAWPADALPPPTSSLLSVASKPGLVAAAGPSSVVIAKADAIRDAFKNITDNGSSVQPFTPQLVLPIGTRISQVAFSVDGSCLAISAEAGGGLAVYEVQQLLNNNTDSAFEMGTNGASVRALIPNPAEATAELFAVVTTNGDLLMASMKTRAMVKGPRGETLKDGVSCVSWSTRGKQLVAGLVDGTIVQMTPEGQPKAAFPRPANLEGRQHVSSITWLENDVFLAGYTPSSSEDDMAPPTAFYVIERNAKASPPKCLFSLLPEVAGPWGMNRSPPFQFISRLKDFEPDLDHAVFVASTASEDIGLYTRSKKPLNDSIPADQITNKFTATVMSKDSRRAQLPMTEDMSGSTSPIGMALDLSSTTSVTRPIPGDELEQSPGPLPALLVLNNEGILAGWWIVYTSSIRQNKSYSGLVASDGEQQAQSTPASATPKHPAFGQNPFAVSSIPASSAFGTTTPKPLSALGASSGTGSQSSPWGAKQIAPSQPSVSAPTFGKPAFGSTSSVGFGRAAFGSPSLPGGGTSLWGQSSSPAAASTASPAFGSTSKPGASGAVNSSPFAAAAEGSQSSAVTAKTGGFADFAKVSGFGVASGENKSGIFGQPSSTNPFGLNTSNLPPTEAAANKDPAPLARAFGSGGNLGPSTQIGAPSTLGKIPNPFAAAIEADTPVSPFAVTPETYGKTGDRFGSNGRFSLDSTFKANATKDKPSEAKEDSKDALFGGEFSGALDAAADMKGPATKEEDMMSDDDKAPESPLSAASPQSTTPADTPGPVKSMGAPPAVGGFFGTQTQQQQTPAIVQNSAPANPFTQPNDTEHLTPKEPKVKSEPKEEGEQGVDKSLPMPPETRSKASYTPGDSSVASSEASKSAEESSTPSKDPGAQEKPSPSPQDTLAPPNPFLKPLPKSVKNESRDAPSPFLAPTMKPPPKQEPDKTAAKPPEPAEEPLDDEGSGVDVGQEISATEESTPESSFNTKNSPGGVFSSMGKTKPKKEGPKSIFDSVKNAPVSFFALPPPTNEPESPRSPSPVRSVKPSDSLKSGRSKAGSGTRKATPGRAQQQRTPQKTVPHIQSTALEEKRKADSRRHKDQEIAELVREEPEEELSDQADDDARRVLETPAEPTLELDEFIARQDYTANVTKDGIPGQIEMVYRDINSMLDTLGLNARSLGAFTEGHGRDIEEWSTDELYPDDPSAPVSFQGIRRLEHLQNNLEHHLALGKLDDHRGLVTRSHHMQQELAKLRTKNGELGRIVNTLKYPEEQQDAIRFAALSSIQVHAQQRLRRKFATFQHSLVEVEEGISLLRSKLASQNNRSKKAGASNDKKVPTIEAIERTISKMTAMAEKKSTDIDALEDQMKEMDILGSRPASRDSTAYSPSTRNVRGGARLRDSVGANGVHSPKASRNFRSSDHGRDERTSAMNLTNGQAGANDTRALAQKMKTRKTANGILKQALGQGAMRVRTLDDGL